MKKNICVIFILIILQVQFINAFRLNSKKEKQCITIELKKPRIKPHYFPLEKLPREIIKHIFSFLIPPHTEQETDEQFEQRIKRIKPRTLDDTGVDTILYFIQKSPHFTSDDFSTFDKLAISYDRSKVVAAYDKKIYAVNLKTGNYMCHDNKHKVRTCAITSNGIVAFTTESNERTIYLLDPVKRSIVKMLSTTSGLYGCSPNILAFNRQETKLASMSNRCDACYGIYDIEQYLRKVPINIQIMKKNFLTRDE